MEVRAHRTISASVRERGGPLLSSPWRSPLPSPPGAHHSPWSLQSLFTCSSSQFYHTGSYPYSRHGVRFGLPCFGLCTNGITLYVFLWDLLLSLKIMLLRFIRLMCSHCCFQFDPNFTELFIYPGNTRATFMVSLSHQLSLHFPIQLWMATLPLISLHVSGHWA